MDGMKKSAHSRLMAVAQKAWYTHTQFYLLMKVYG